MPYSPQLLEDMDFPGKHFALANIPIAVPRHFLGRDDTIEVIDAALNRHDGRVAVAALHGLRGVGKTTIAAAYAERHRADYRATWWIRAQTDSTMRADLVALGVRLGWVATEEKEGQALDKVQERLRDEGEGLLLIFDNAIDAASLKPYLPLGGAARILVTSNSPTWQAIATRVEIEVWSKNVGADYLIARTGRDLERADAEALSDSLGGLPLAHEQAAAYCERLDVSLAEYMKRFSKAAGRLLDAEKDAPATFHGGLTVAKAFNLAIDEAAKLHPAAEPVIVFAALLAPESVPLFLFSEGREKFGEPLASQLADDGLDKAVAALSALALVEREAIPDERDPSITTETIRLHRLVRTVAAGRLQADAAEAARRVLIEVMATVYPGAVNNDPSSWPRARRLDALALDLVDGEVELPRETEASASYLLDRLGSYRMAALGAFSEARPLLARALGIREKVLGPEHAATVTSLNNLAGLFQMEGNPAAARPLLERALAISEKTLGADHPSTGTSLNNLAWILQVQGDLAGARPLYERALAIYEKALGPNHPNTVTSLSNLAGLLQAQGDSGAARPLLERALATSEKALGSEHPWTATILHNLAWVLNATGDPAGARPLLERALAINEKALGPQHPDTAESLNNLATVLQEQGDLAGAQPLYERALAITEKTLGGGHPNTNRTRSHLGRLRLSAGDASAALAMAETALAAHDKILGAGDAWTKDSARLTADALDALGRAEEAAAVRAKYGLSGGPAALKA